MLSSTYNSQIRCIKPIIKWAGGKTQLLNEINLNLPNKNILDNIETYIEPFLGGGSMLLNVISKLPNVKKVYVNDINERLINLYKNVKCNVNELIDILDKINDEFSSLIDIQSKSEYYYNIRKEFNDIIKYNTLKNSAQFIFLNKYGFNGIYRENSKGEFNIPFNKSNKLISLYNKENIYELHNFLIKHDIVFYNKPYNEFLESIFNILYRKDNKINTKSRIKAFEHTFIYFDPPYRPLNINKSKSAQSVQYSKSTDIFSDEFQIGIEKYYSLFSDYGAYCMLSNSDPHNTDSTDNFFDNLYNGSNINRVNVKRLLSSKASSRGTVTELLITNY